MVPVVFAALREGAVVGIIVLGIEHPTRSAVLRYAFPPQTGHVSAERRSPGSVPYDTGFDGNTPRSLCHQPRGRDARGPAAAEGSAAAGTQGSTLQSTGLLGSCQRPRNERFGAMHAAPSPVPDAAKPDAEITI